MTISFSLKEAAAIAEVPERDIRKAIGAKTIRPRVIAAGRAPRYQFRVHDLVYLKLITDFPLPLPAEDKQALQDVVGMKHRASGRWRRRADDVVLEAGVDVLRVEVRPVRNWIARRLRVFHRGRRRIVSVPDILGGEPVFEGTRIPLAHITGLVAKGVPIDEIREDYPSLGPGDLEYAALVARMKPNPGRPRKPLVLLRGEKGVKATNHGAGRRATPVG